MQVSTARASSKGRHRKRSFKAQGTRTNRPPSLRRNLLWNLATGPIVLLGNLVLVALAVRLAGAYQYGVWAVAFGTTTLLAQADLGIGTALIRQLASARAHGDEELASSLRRYGRSLFALVGLIVGALLGVSLSTYFLLFTPTDSPWQVMVVINAIATPLVFIGRYYGANLQANGHFLPDRAFSSLSLLVRGSIIFYGFYEHPTISIVIISDICGLALLAVGSFVSARLLCDLNHTGNRDRTVLRTLVAFGLKSFVGSFASLASIQAPLYFVGPILGYTDAAAYSAVLRFMISAKIVVSWVSGPFLPAVAVSSISSSLAVVQRQYNLSMLIVGCLNGTYVTVMVSAGGDMLGLWLGPQFQNYGAFVAVIGAAIFIACITAPGDTFATAIGHPGLVAWQASASCALTVVLSAVLPRYLGLEGAASALLVPLAIAFPLGQWAIQRRTGIRWISIAATVTCITAAGAAAAILVHDLEPNPDYSELSRLISTALTGGGVVVLLGVLAGIRILRSQSLGIRAASSLPGEQDELDFQLRANLD